MIEMMANSSGSSDLGSITSSVAGFMTTQTGKVDFTNTSTLNKGVI